MTASFCRRTFLQLLKFCETRWVEHLNSLSLFHGVYEHVCSSLEELDEKLMEYNPIVYLHQYALLNLL